MLKVVTKESEFRKDFELSLDEIARAGALKMLKAALSAEAEDYVSRFKSERDEDGKCLVTKNGVGKTRSVALGSGVVEVEAPRVNDKRVDQKFISDILPPYLRKSPKVDSLIPVLYLKDLSTNDFKAALGDFLGEGTHGLSPASIVKLKSSWDDEFDHWMRRPILNKYIYIWADGVNMQVRLGEDKKVCLLVIIGVTPEGKKELLAVGPGYRESTESWSVVLRSLTSRGFKAPLVACGDGALGFWKAVRQCEGFEKTREQRCWVHKIANVLDKLPKRLQPDAKRMLHEMMRADKKESAEKEKVIFETTFQDKYPKALDCLNKSWSELTTFFDYPAQHWVHLRTTNPIESAFATVKLRTKVTKGAGNTKTAATMAFKLLKECEKKWRKINGVEEIGNLFNGVEYKDGVVITTKSDQETVAS